MWLNVVLTPPGSLPLSQSPGTELSASCGYCCPLCPTGVSIRGKFVLSSLEDKWAPKTCAGCPKQRYATGEPGKGQRRERVCIVESCSGYRTRGVSVREQFVLSRNPGYKTRGFRHVAKRSSDPRVAYPEVKVQVRDLVRLVCIVAPFAPRTRGSIRGKFVLSSTRG